MFLIINMNGGSAISNNSWHDFLEMISTGVTHYTVDPKVAEIHTQKGMNASFRTFYCWLNKSWIKYEFQSHPIPMLATLIFFLYLKHERSSNIKGLNLARWFLDGGEFYKLLLMFINALIDLVVFNESMTCCVWPNSAMSEPSSQTSSLTILFLSPPPPPLPSLLLMLTVTVIASYTVLLTTFPCHYTTTNLCHLTASTTPCPHCLCAMPCHLSLSHLNSAIVTITSLLPILSATVIIATMSPCPHLIQHYLYCFTGKHMTASSSHHWPEPP